MTRHSDPRPQPQLIDRPEAELDLGSVIELGLTALNRCMAALYGTRAELLPRVHPRDKK